MRTIILIFSFFIAGFSLNAQPVLNKSYTTKQGEKVLRFEFIVPVHRGEAWKYFTTDDLLKWIAPVAHIQLRTGGYILTNYNENKNLDDSSSIRLGITNYLEEELLTLKVKLNNNFPARVQQQDQNLQELIQFIDLKNGKTKIISSMIGWGDGPEWDETYKKFVAGNKWTYEQFMKLFK